MKEESPEPALPFPVVGIGASAGGLEAVSRLLRSVSPRSGMAFVVVQHLHPDQPTLLAEILGRATPMKVELAEDGRRIEPDHVYVLPPGRILTVTEGSLRLAPRVDPRLEHREVDHLLRSLAADQLHLAIGVVLSGTGSDGTLGLAEVKAAGGVTFAQDASAQHTGMPAHATESGAVDFELPPEEIAAELERIAGLPFVRAAAAEVEAPLQEGALEQVLRILLHATGVDFGEYKRATLERRIHRRMALQKIADLIDYIRALQRSPDEVDRLFRDLLINVTQFFRDLQAFDFIKTSVFPRLTEGRSRHAPLRVWVPGCSTGEEAYSVAIAYAEFAESTGCAVPLQLFATDLNGAAIEKARAGIYSLGISQDVSPERLRRFFIESDGSFRIDRAIRDRCIFAQHNVLSDPPFSNIDLISCRNLLIYLGTRAHQRLIPLLHYSLKPTGYLCLGGSETIGAFDDLFEVVDAKHRVYWRRAGPGRIIPALPARVSVPTRYATAQLPRPRPLIPPVPEAQREADRIMLSRYSAPAVLIDDNLDVLQFRGDTSRFLAPSPGRASLSLLNMLREGLLVPLRGALHKARKDEARVREEGVQVRRDGATFETNLEVIPLTATPDYGRCYLVVFDESGSKDDMRARVSRAEDAAREAGKLRTSESPGKEVERLSQELTATREYLQSLVEQGESSNEELQAANEEIQSANEELQSINEELQTSKEEIESSNEELATVNETLQRRNAELAESNADLANLLASVRMAIVMLGPDLRIRTFTPAAGNLLSLISTDVGRPIGDLRLSAGVPDLEKQLAQVLESSQPRELESRGRDGRWYSIRMRPYRSAANRVEGVVLMLVDIDSLKRGEQAVRASAGRLRMVHDQAPVGIVESDSGGKILDVNDRLCRMLGYTRQEILEKRLQDLFHPDDAAAVRIRPDAAALGDSQWRHFESRMLRKDGDIIWADFAFALAAAAEGESEFSICVVQDVSERRQSGAALHESEARFRTLADSAPVLIWVNDLDGCEFVNRAYREFLGVEEVELLGDGWAQFVHPEDRESYIALYREALAGGTPLSAQFRFRRADGQYRWMKSMGTPRFDANGLVCGFVGSSFDVHDLKIAEAALREADRSKNEFLAMLAHELRNPLAPMRNVIEIFKAPDVDDAVRQWGRETLERQVEAMARMTEDLLDVSRITQGKIQLRLEPVDLAPVAERAARNWKHRLALREQELSVELREAPLPVLGDLVRLEQVVSNLLGNAAKFTPRGGHIALEAGADSNDWVSLKVRDDGEGISAEDLPRIFDLFVQVDRSLGRAHGGLGIGLTMVKRLVDLHGGQVAVRSEGPGKGSEFEVRLPRLATTPRTFRSRNGSEIPFRQGRARRILVVDDNSDAATSCAMLLRRSGHEVEVANDGHSALEIARRFDPEVAVLDIGMPIMDGYELARKLRALPRTGTLALIAVSGYDSEEDRRLGREAGFDRHIRKPVDLEVLLEEIETAP